MVAHPGAVAVLALDEKGQVLLVRQEREGAGRALWEIPAGVLERGERPLEAAKRELLEETGLSARSWRYLGTMYSTPGYSTERVYVFLASGLSGICGARSEVDAVRFSTRDEITREARAGRGDGKTLAALQLLDWPFA